ncbi:MAG: triose-phosphate isomerase [Candidatus Saccharibacteria bacterium]|nr:triose-phosphate isomerase [Moraxellaceae bacterium]
MSTSTTITPSTTAIRQHWVIGNWKMNPSLATAKSLTEKLSENLVKTTSLSRCKLAIAPTTLHMLAIKSILEQASAQIQLVAQDTAITRNTGAFTGDISADLLKEAGIEWVIIGHSERRTIHHEDEKLISQKIRATLDTGLGVIWCVGETLEQREAGQAMNVVTAQIQAHTDILTNIDINKLIIAYEPVWAIGTGRTASPEDAQQMHGSLRQMLTQIRAELNQTSLLYGGSVKSDNAYLLAKCPDIDGALVGGASLDADSFLQIAQAFDIA